MRGSILLAMAAAIAAPLPAQPAPPAQAPGAQPGDIVVQGTRRQQQKTLRKFVTTLTPAKADQQLGRFHWPVCPLAVGLAARENAAIIARLRQVARASGVPVAPARCAPNLFVIATTSKRAFIEKLGREQPKLFGDWPRDRLRALANSPGPTAGWQVADHLDQNGNILPRHPIFKYTTVSSFDATRLNKATQAHFVGALLVVERGALAGVSTRQLADYAAMRTLAPVDPLSYRHALAGNPGAELPAPSILDLFGQSAAAEPAPPSVTWWDFAFLRALYDSTATRSSTLQRGDIQARMNQILASVPADEL